MNRSIFRLAWRHTRRRPLQSLFFVVGVAIGVAMIIAIDLANGSASRAFALGTESVAGRATHQIVGGPSGLDEAVYVDLRRELGYRDSAPVVESYVTAVELDAQPMRLLGIDPFAEAPFRSYLGTNPTSPLNPSADFLADLMTRPNSTLLSTEVAEQYGFVTGDELTIRIGSETTALEIVGLLEPSDDLSQRALSGLLIIDIATAQEVLDRVGTLNRVDLILPENDEAAAAATARIESILPENARVERSSARSGTIDSMTEAFSLNLTALSLLALVVGMFLIYNTVTFSVIQRRPVLGSLRALGMTRREIFGMILLEAGILGAIGTALGLGLGILLGRGAVQAVTQTVNDLFFVVAVRDTGIPTFTLVKGAVIGISAALLAAVIPAVEATGVAPAGAFRRSHIEDRARQLLPWLTGAGALLATAGALIMLPEWPLSIAFAGLFGIVIGAALMTPAVTLGLMWLAEMAAKRGGVIERMAPRTVVRSLSRTTVAVAALMVAVSVIIGVGIMVGSFRQTVVLWLDDVLQADIFVTPPTQGANASASRIDSSVVGTLANFDGVARYATTRGASVAAFVDGEEEPPSTVNFVSFSEDLAGADRRYRAAIGDWEQTWQAVLNGGIVINEPMANRTGLGVGDQLPVQTDRGLRNFEIVGVSIDFDVNMTAFTAAEVFGEFFDDSDPSAVAIFVEPGVSVDETVDAMRAQFAGEQELLISSNRGLRANAIAIFDRTFAITVALQLLATIVAFIGILSTLMSLQLERTREIGVLRANGMTRRQLWRLSLLETGLIGSTAGLIALPVGFVLALVLIYIINLRSFGWTLEMQLLPGEFVQAFLVALVAALLAGIYPAWRMGQVQPAEAVRAE